MRYIFIIVCTCIVIFLFAFCDRNKENNDSLVSIDIEANYENMEVINLSRFACKIRYVKLDLNESFAFSYISQLEQSGNLLLISDMTSCLLFDTTGRFLTKIGTRGRGPGEYNYISDLEITPDGKVYIKDLYDLLEYKTDGTFVKEYPNFFLKKEKDFLSVFSIVNDSLFFCHIPNSTGIKDYRAMITDRKGNAVVSYKNFLKFEREKEVASTQENRAIMYRFGGNLHYKTIFEDTLFILNENFRLVPEYVFNLGKFKEPISEISNLANRNMFKYFYLNKVFETKNYLFPVCQFGENFPAKRSTPRSVPIQTLKPIMYNTTEALGIFDKKTGKLAFCKPTSTDNPLFTSGLYNDIDAGPRFKPDNMINDSTMVMYIRVQELIDHVAGEDFKNNTPKYSERKVELEKFVKSLTPFDNPVLMFVTFNL
jgi:hypothetical protein